MTSAKTLRIYIVVDVNDLGGARLIRAPSPHAALRHVVASRLHSRLAEQDDIVRLMSAGKKVETLDEAPAEVDEFEEDLFDQPGLVPG